MSKWKTEIKRLQIHGITSDHPLWRQFKGVATMEGKTIAEALKEAIKLWLRERGVEPKDEDRD